jgi:hypothetical protein
MRDGVGSPPVQPGTETPGDTKYPGRIDGRPRQENPLMIGRYEIVGVSPLSRPISFGISSITYRSPVRDITAWFRITYTNT